MAPELTSVMAYRNGLLQWNSITGGFAGFSFFAQTVLWCMFRDSFKSMASPESEMPSFSHTSVGFVTCIVEGLIVSLIAGTPRKSSQSQSAR